VTLYESLQAKVTRDRSGGLALARLVRKGLRYAGELATAPLYLHAATEVGQGVRTLGRPRIDNQGTLRIGRGTLLRSVNVPVELGVGPGATLTIGEESSINYGVSMGAMRSITIGHRVRIGPYAMIIDTEFHGVYDRKSMPEPRPVVLEDDVWVGAKATILPGVTVGRGSIIGVSSVVVADVPPFTVVVGVPARPVRKLDPAQFVVR
jgi:maltose O-acetyltransferase